VDQVYQNIGHVVVMMVLLVCSAFFSGSETSFFNLTRRQVSLLSQSKHKLQVLAARLLNKPKQLLSCLLFGNMTVNVLFYAISSVLIVRVGRQVGTGAAAVTAFISFAVLVLFGEILPKSLAYANSRSVSVAAALPLVLCLHIFAPLHFVFRVFIVEPTLRLFLGPLKPAKPISTGEFKSLIEQVRKRGLITADENKLLGEIVELGFLKVRHVMQPRVDMIACNVTDSAESAHKKMIKYHLTKLPVYAGTIDNIVGLVYLRQLLLEGEALLDKLVQRVHFVPEQKTVESLLEFFREMGTDTAIVVDEYGGIAGSVRLEDIAEELLGPIEAAEGIELVETIGPFKYRLAGDVSIHDWAEAFGIDPEQAKVTTIGGLVTNLLGRIPKSGDTAYLHNLKFTVERVRKHRIKTVILTLEAAGSNGQ
jgi:CBS domain containing-hemolysin-like protein